jgi:phosphatidylinositol-3-phosphatase
MRMTTARTHAGPHDRCPQCNAALLGDQRYCLQCGERRGTPRLDFTTFWKPLSLTGEREQAKSASESLDTSGARTSRPMAPSRRLAGTLAAGMLAAGIVLGAALGPAPASSPADSSTLAQQVIAALATRTEGAPRASPPVGPKVSATESKAAATTAPVHKSKTASKEASAPAPSQDASSESAADTPPSEGASPRDSSSKGSSEGAAPDAPVKLPSIKHVWLILVSGQGFAGAFAQSKAGSYLAKELASKGTLLSGYKLSASSELANGVALLSGQRVNLDTEQNCPTYVDLQPASVNATNGLAEGVGCVYPPAVKTLPDELTASGLTWKAYLQGMEGGQSSAGASGVAGVSTSPTPSANQPAGVGTSASASAPATSSVDATTPAPSATASCRHPELGTPDPSHSSTPGDSYLTFRNPFVYFHSLLDSGACMSSDVDLSRLQGDLATPESTSSLSWIVPSACNDGSSAPCAPDAPAGPAALDRFLEEVVPKILATAAYREGGLIEILPDSAPTPSASATAKPVGALLISPFARAGAHVSEPLNDFSLSKSLARIFGVLPLGHANDASTISFGASVYRTS